MVNYFCGSNYVDYISSFSCGRKNACVCSKYVHMCMANVLVMRQIFAQNLFAVCATIKIAQVKCYRIFFFEWKELTIPMLLVLFLF